MQKPVIVPDTRGIQDYFSDAEMIFFKAVTLMIWRAKMEWAYANPAELAVHLAEGAGDL